MAAFKNTSPVIKNPVVSAGRIFSLNQMIQSALAEDRISEDISTRLLIAPDRKARARVIFKNPGVMCGGAMIRKAFKLTDHSLKVEIFFSDGTKIRKNQTVIRVAGRIVSILAAERVVLNFLGYLSGVATRTREYVDAVRSYKVQILDTRKTTPLMRDLERYAVRCGGGCNHRRDLSDMVLIKDNHLPAYGTMKLSGLVRAVRARTKKKIEIEVDRLDQFLDAIEGHPDMILLDNMSCKDMKKAVGIAERFGSRRPLLEASGGVTLKNIKRVAATGVDRISVGALTHSRQSVDVSLEFLS